MRSYEFKFVCQKCGAVHWYRPLKGCQRCGKFFIKKVSNMSEELENEDDYLELKLTIDKYDLENEWAEHPTMVYAWAENAANTQLQFDKAKQKLDLIKAELDHEIRIFPENFDLKKNPEKAIENTIILQPEYQAAVRNMNSAKHDLKIADAAMIGLEHRRKGLALMVELWIRNYYSNKVPQTDSEEGKDFETHEVRTRGQRHRPLARQKADSIDDLNNIEPDDDLIDDALDPNGDDYLNAILDDDFKDDLIDND